MKIHNYVTKDDQCLLTGLPLKDQYNHEKIIHLLSLPIKYNLKINHQDAFSSSTSVCSQDIHLLKQVIKLKLICDVICLRIRNEIYDETIQSVSLKEPIKFLQFFRENAPTLHYTTVTVFA